ncbi:MAG: hypothetical protein DLM70_04865 [Chloroflexi bacterium]|nr:MAG: hypothetical protein DLM70_04865 [Chloroflexota bacterium]
MTKSSGVSPIVWVGIGTDCDFRAEDIQTIGLKGVRFTLRAEGRRFSIRTRVPGVHTVHAFLFAAAVARSVGMAWCEIQAAMEDVRLETRQRIVHLRCDNVVLIDDTYNASPPSMRAALDVLASGTGVKIAVLGDMLELGPDEEAAHIEIGQEVARAADWLVARGERGAWIGDGAERAGMETRRIVRAATNADALHAVASLIRGALATGAATSSPKMRGSWERSKDANEWTVLVKGSRGMGMEEVVSGLIGASSC